MKETHAMAPLMVRIPQQGFMPSLNEDKGTKTSLSWAFYEKITFVFYAVIKYERVWWLFKNSGQRIHFLLFLLQRQTADVYKHLHDMMSQ